MQSVHFTNLTKVRPSGLALALCALASCSSASGVEHASELAAATPDFQTDSASYTLKATTVGYEGAIGVTFTNRTSTTANFVNCKGGTAFELQKLIDGGWKTVWSPDLLLCLSPPIVVPPSGQQRSTIRIFGGYPGSTFFPQFSIADVAGTYRAVWTQVVTNYQDRLPFGNPLPLEHRISNQFTLAAQPRPRSADAQPYSSR